MVKKQGKPEKEYRSFTIVGSSIGFQGGNFISLNPNGASKKAATALWRLLDKDPEFSKLKAETEKANLIEFIIREKTRNSKHAVFSYSSKKVKLSTPKERVLPNGTTIKIMHVLNVKTLKEAEFSAGFKRTLAGGGFF